MSGIRIVLRYPELAITRLTRSVLTGGCPSRSMVVDQQHPASGSWLLKAALVTPGTALTLSVSRRR